MKFSCALLFWLWFSGYFVVGKDVYIFHLIDNALWGEVDGSALQGVFPCNNRCQLISSDSNAELVDNLKSKLVALQNSLRETSFITVSLYNIHTWGEHSKWPHGPNHCLLPTDLSMAESEESHGRFGKLFQASFKLYDGYSTTSPFSSVQRTYFTGLNASSFLPLKPFDRLIKGASFVASTCHRGDGTTKRISLMIELQKQLRVDSLGKCHHTKDIPEGIVLKQGSTAQESLQLKQEAISNYLFYFAFENTNERGYVTEKVFDALIAGVVPVYLGSSTDCKSLMPHPKAAIYVDDFRGNTTALGEYLISLMHDEAAYEKHRAWRQSFDPNAQSFLFTSSWPCRICDWAEERYQHPRLPKPPCNNA